MVEIVTHFEAVPLGLLKITNLSIDEKKVDAIVHELNLGKYLGVLYVHYSREDGYQVNDGNHRTLAMRKIHYKKALCEIYTSEQ